MKKTTVDMKSVVKDLTERPKRSKVSFTFVSDTFDGFQKRCVQEGFPVSRALEKLMAEFNEAIEFDPKKYQMALKKKKK